MGDQGSKNMRNRLVKKRNGRHAKDPKLESNENYVFTFSVIKTWEKLVQTELSNGTLLLTQIQASSRLRDNFYLI